MKIYGKVGNQRVNKILIAAEILGVKIELINLTTEQLKAQEFLAKSPFGKYPVLECDCGKFLCESNAILRYLARSNKKLYGANECESGLVDQWLDFLQNEIEPPIIAILLPLIGYATFDPCIKKKATSDFINALKVLNTQLAQSTFLIGNEITIADIAIVSCLVKPFLFAIPSGMLKQVANVIRWFETCRNQAPFHKFLGKVTYCKKEFNLPKVSQEAKKEEPKKVEKKEEKKEEKKVEKKVEAPKKEVNPLDLLPPTNFNIEEYKRTYMNAPSKKQACDEFLKVFDPKGFSIWILKYDKYTGEGEKLHLTNNLFNGYLQKIDPKFRKYAIAIHGVYGEEPNLDIKGCWVVRGLEVPCELKKHQAGEYHKYIKLDISKKEDEAKFREFFENVVEDESKVEGQRLRTLDIYR